MTELRGLDTLRVVVNGDIRFLSRAQLSSTADPLASLLAIVAGGDASLSSQLVVVDDEERRVSSSHDFASLPVGATLRLRLPGRSDGYSSMLWKWCVRRSERARCDQVGRGLFFRTLAPLSSEPLLI